MVMKNRMITYFWSNHYILLSYFMLSYIVICPKARILHIVELRGRSFHLKKHVFSNQLGAA